MLLKDFKLGTVSKPLFFNPYPFDNLKKDPELTADIQTALFNLGLLRSGIDGIYGNDTQNALVRFKRLNKFTGGNILLAPDIRELQRALAAGSPNLVTNTQATAIYGTRLYPQEIADLNKTLDYFDIESLEQIRIFMAQTAHESGGLKWFLELASGDDYEYNDDLGNTQPGDGRKFKGAGALQLTGRNNYRLLRDYTRDERVLSEGATYVAKTYPFFSAGVWWKANDVNRKITNGASNYLIGKLVNTGNMYSSFEANGAEDRAYYYDIARRVIV